MADQKMHDWVDKHDPRMERWPAIRASMPETGGRFCLVCGVMEQRNGQNKPCSGVTPRIELRGSR
jgi:hypothetical protein